MTKLNIGIPVPSISFLPSWAADQQGFFKEEGFTEIKILAFRGDADVVQALVAGTVDISIASLTGVVLSIKAGQRFKAVWAGYNMPYFDWYALPKFKSIAETKGARYAVTKYGALTDFLTRYALRSVGLDPEKDVKILQLGGFPQSLAAMDAGHLDASILSPPSSYMAAEKGYVKIMSQKEQIAPDWPLHVIYAKEEFIAKNPNTMKAFLRARGKATEWIKSNPDEAAKLAHKQTKFKLEHCLKTIVEIRDEWHSDGRLPGKGMKVFWDIAVQAGDVTEPWPDTKWLDQTFLKTQDQWRK
ncbi:MAG: ABC transporter substrate-binding protein [Thermodesulfobacteriota bacterium]|nr:ABC transporter substrate-binding protein [Thermodesulfobacteriota bacterium]